MQLLKKDGEYTDMESLLQSKRTKRKPHCSKAPCPTLCDRMDSTVPGILQARTLQWGAFPFSRGSSQPGGRTQVSRIAGGFFTS